MLIESSNNEKIVDNSKQIIYNFLKGWNKMTDTPVRIGTQATLKLNVLQSILTLTKKAIVEKLINAVDVNKVRKERRLS